jgi:hypothetical protein
LEPDHAVLEAVPEGELCSGHAECFTNRLDPSTWWARKNFYVLQ